MTAVTCCVPKTQFWGFSVHYSGESGGWIMMEAKGEGALQASAQARGQERVASLTWKIFFENFFRYFSNIFQGGVPHRLLPLVVFETRLDLSRGPLLNLRVSVGIWKREIFEVESMKHERKRFESPKYEECYRLWGSTVCHLYDLIRGWDNHN